jgi:hypothetical protein
MNSINVAVTRHGKPEGTMEMPSPPKRNAALPPAYLNTFLIPKYFPINCFAARQKTIDILAVWGVVRFTGMIVNLLACLELFLVANLKWILLSNTKQSMKEYSTPNTGHQIYLEYADMQGRTYTFEFFPFEYI